MDDKIGVNACQAGNEMTFPIFKSCFGGMSAMDVGRRKLVVKRDRFHVEFEAVGKFFVQDL